MICHLSKAILNYISKHVDISADMKDIYQYGIEITLSSILNFTLIVLCSLILRSLSAGLIYLFVFIFVRSYSGGYHATTYFRCNLTFVVTFVITFYSHRLIAECWYSVVVCGVLALISLIPFFLFSPVSNKFKPLNDKQKKSAFILSVVIASVLSVIGLSLLALGISLGAMIIATIAMISVLILVETFMQRRGYHES